MFTSLLLLVALVQPAQAADVTVAGHRGVFTGEALNWESDYALTYSGSDDDDVLRFAVPLPANAAVVLTNPDSAVLLNENGAVYGIRLPHQTAWAHIEVHQTAVAGETLLAAPLAEGTAVQRVVLDHAAFQPDPGLGVRRGLNGMRQVGVTQGDRRGIDRALGVVVHPGHPPLYLVADTRLTDLGGLRGELQPQGAVTAATPVVIGLSFAALLGLLAISLRLLRKLSEAEAVDAYVRQEFVRSTKELDPPGNF